MGAAGSIESGKEASAPTGRAGHKERVAELESVLGRTGSQAPRGHFDQIPGTVVHLLPKDFKVLLMELGCTVYNPNTDNVEICEAIPKALSTKERVEPTKGFILQIQQGTTHQESDMQVAEEMQTNWLQLPRIAVYSFDTSSARTLVGGNTLAKKYMETALKQAEEQWRNGVWSTLQMCSERYKAVDGGDQAPTDPGGRVHGRAKCIFASGSVYDGEWHHGKRHGKGTFTWPDSAVYDGEWQHGNMHGKGTLTYADGGVYDGEYQDDKRHGKGKYTWPDGDCELGFYVAGKDSGEGVKFTKDRQKAWLLKDGEEVRELSPSEATKKVQELGLSRLLK